MWGGYWAMPWGGFGWILPLVFLVAMLGMALLCFRRMCGCMLGHGHHGDGAIEELRQEVGELREEVRKLRER